MGMHKCEKHKIDLIQDIRKSIFFGCDVYNINCARTCGPSADTVAIQRVASLQQPSLYTF